MIQPPIDIKGMSRTEVMQVAIWRALIELGNPLDGYIPTDKDETADPAYYGFIKNGGQWYIMTVSAAGAIRYCTGTNNYQAAWTAKSSQIYDYANKVNFSQ